MTPSRPMTAQELTRASMENSVDGLKGKVNQTRL
jgi:hypothetical protein